MKYAALTLALLASSALSGCYIHSYPVTAEVAEESTYELFAGDFQGTAWSVSDHYLVTAGHMCEAGGPGPYVALSSTRRRLLVSPVAWELSGPLARPQSDMCLLRTDAGLAPGLVLATELPAAGATVEFTGWPVGGFVREEGTYAGAVDDLPQDEFAFTAPVDHGASGSALFTARGVIGIVVRLRLDGQPGGSMTPITLVLPLLDDMGVPYVTTPSVPVDDTGVWHG